MLFVNLPEFAAIQPQYPAFVKKLEEYAPGAKQAKIDIPNSAIGTTSADRIVSYLRSHPDVNFVALSQDALSAGLPAAMKAAGLDVPFSGDGGGPQPRELVASGQQAASVEFPIDQVFWTLVDGIDPVEERRVHRAGRARPSTRRRTSSSRRTTWEARRRRSSTASRTSTRSSGESSRQAVPEEAAGGSPPAVIPRVTKKRRRESDPDGGAREFRRRVGHRAAAADAAGAEVRAANPGPGRDRRDAGAGASVHRPGGDRRGRVRRAARRRLRVLDPPRTWARGRQGLGPGRLHGRAVRAGDRRLPGQGRLDAHGRHVARDHRRQRHRRRRHPDRRRRGAVRAACAGPIRSPSRSSARAPRTRAPSTSR